MFILFAAILAVVWLAGITILHTSATAIHLLLILAVGSLLVHLFRARRVAGHH